MTTVTIQVGNSDDKLTQLEWSTFVDEMCNAIESAEVGLHFFGASPNYEKWQNAAWVITSESADLYPAKTLGALKAKLVEIRARFKQDSLAWTEGVTEFV